MDLAAPRRLAIELWPATGVLAVYAALPLTGRPAPFVAALGVVGLVVAVVPLAVRRSVEIQMSSRPLGAALRTVSLIATLIVVVFAIVHRVVADRDPTQYVGLATKIDALYFSVSTIATVGFGDITAVGQGARVLVTLHIVLGLVLLGLSVRLVERALTAGRGSGDAAG